MRRPLVSSALLLLLLACGGDEAPPSQGIGAAGAALAGQGGGGSAGASGATGAGAAGDGGEGGSAGAGGSDAGGSGGAAGSSGAGGSGAGNGGAAGSGGSAGQGGTAGAGGSAGAGRSGGGGVGPRGSAGRRGAGGAAGSGAGVTTLRVHYPVKPGQVVTIRGDAGGLNWEAGAAAAAEDPTLWIFSTTTVVDDVEWKPLLDDAVWARGPNYLAKAGSVVDVYPHFQVTSGAVELYKQGFASKHLAETRDLWVYLPPTYLENTEAHFPVLYMHDGQNLFDKALAFGGNEWQVDEAFDEAAESGAIREAVVVGVGNTSARIFEYTPTPDPEYTPSGGGDGYLALLVEDLKPLIDAEFRTLPGRETTALMGSSLGGLISSYGGVQRPEVFGLIGAMSPSVWWDNKVVLGQVASIQGKPLRALRVYVDSGDAGPSEDGFANTKLLAEQYKTVGYQEGVDFLYTVQPGATHSEFYWAQRFPEAAAFLLGSRPDSGSKPF